MIFFLIIAVLVVFYPFYILYSTSSWTKGKIPFGFLATAAHEAEMLTTLSMNFVRLEKKDQKEKMKLIYDYINKFYSPLSIYYKNVMHNAKIHNLPNNEIGKWFAKKVKSEAKRSNILYFVSGICTEDGNFNSRELSELKKLSRSLNLPNHYLEKFIAMHFVKQERQRENRQKESYKESQRQKSAKRQNFLKILGLNTTSNDDEIKQAYRNLVKIHHPDMQQGRSKLQKEIANQKFLEIQQAYEALT